LGAPLEQLCVDTDKLASVCIVSGAAPVAEKTYRDALVAAEKAKNYCPAACQIAESYMRLLSALRPQDNLTEVKASLRRFLKP